METRDVSVVLARHYVSVRVTVSDEKWLNAPGGAALMARLGGRDVPYYVMLDQSGAQLPQTQGHGLPWDNVSTDAFLAIFTRHAPRMTSIERDLLANALLLQRTPRLEVVSTRRVWSSMDLDYRQIALSSDGRYFAFNDTFHWGNLFVHDLKASEDRFAVSNRAPDGTEYRGAALWGGAFSPDNQFVAFTWRSNATGRGELRVATFEDRVPAESRRLVGGDGIEWVRPYDWSLDGKWIAAQVWRKDAWDIALVSPAGGAVRVLKSLPRRPPKGRNPEESLAKGMAFSPDGRYVAFEHFPETDSSRRDIRVISTDGSKEIPAVVHAADDGLVGWLPDGKRLLFTSDRTGRLELWTATFHDDAFDAPAVVPGGSLLGNITPVGMTAKGAFAYFTLPSRQNDVWAGVVDFETGEWRQRPAELVQEFVGRNSAAQWSPDGGRLAYQSRRDPGSVIVVRSLDDERAREFPAPNPLTAFSWSPDGRALALGTVKDGAGIVLQLDPATGTSTVIASGAGGAQLQRWSAGGRLYVDRPVPGGTGANRQTAVIERDIESGAEREVFRGQSGGGARLAISPDGRTIYYRRPVPAASPPHDLVARDVATGAERVLVTQQPLGRVTLSADGRHILTTTTDSPEGPTVLLLVPTAAGSAPRRLQVDRGEATGNLSWVALAPDSRSTLALRTFGDWIAESPGRSELWWIPFDGRSPKLLEVLPAGAWLSDATLHPDGRLAFTRTMYLPGGLWMMEFGSQSGVVR